MPGTTTIRFRSKRRRPRRSHRRDRTYWRLTIEPYWDRVRLGLDDDIAYRTEMFITSGLATAVHSLPRRCNCEVRRYTSRRWPTASNSVYAFAADFSCPVDGS